MYSDGLRKREIEKENRQGSAYVFECVLEIYLSSYKWCHRTLRDMRPYLRSIKTLRVNLLFYLESNIIYLISSMAYIGNNTCNLNWRWTLMLENPAGFTRSILRTLFIALNIRIGNPNNQWHMRQSQNQASNENAICYEVEPRMA